MNYFQTGGPFVAPSIYQPLPLDYFKTEVDKLQNRYDLTNKMMATKMDEVAGMEYIDPNARNKTINDLQTSLDEITDKYQGDLARASGELVKRIGVERQNPWYNLNRYQVEQSKIEQQLGAKYGPNAILKNRVTEKQLLDPETGQFISREDLTADVVEASDYTKNTELMAKDLQQHAREIALQRYGQIPGYLQFGSISELTPEQLGQYVSSPEFVEAWKTMNPTYEFDNREAVNYDPTTDTNKFSTDEGIANFAYGVLQDKIGIDRKMQYTPDFTYKMYLDDALARKRDRAKADYEYALNTGNTFGTPFSGVEVKPDDRGKMIENVKNKTTQINDIDRKLDQVKSLLTGTQGPSGIGDIGRYVTDKVSANIAFDTKFINPDGTVKEDAFFMLEDDNQRRALLAYNDLQLQKQSIEEERAITESFLRDVDSQMANQGKGFLSDDNLDNMLKDDVKGLEKISRILGTGTIGEIVRLSKKYGFSAGPTAELDKDVMNALGLDNAKDFREFIQNSSGRKKEDVIAELQERIDRSALADVNKLKYNPTLLTLNSIAKAYDGKVSDFLETNDIKSTGLLGYTNTSDKSGVSTLNNGMSGYLNNLGNINAVSGLTEIRTGIPISEELINMGFDPNKPIKYKTTIGRVEKTGNPVYLVTATGTAKDGGTITSKPLVAPIGDNSYLMANFDNGMSEWFKEETYGIDPNKWATNPQVDEVAINYGTSLVGDKLWTHPLKTRKDPYSFRDRKGNNWKVVPHDVAGTRQYDLYSGKYKIQEGLGDETAIARTIGLLQLLEDTNQDYLLSTSPNLRKEKPAFFKSNLERE